MHILIQGLCKIIMLPRWVPFALIAIALINCIPFVETIGASYEWHHPGPALVNIRFFVGILIALTALTFRSSKGIRKYLPIVFLFMIFFNSHSMVDYLSYNKKRAYSWLVAYSGPSCPLIPVEVVHRFRFELSSDSSGGCPAIPFWSWPLFEAVLERVANAPESVAKFRNPPGGISERCWSMPVNLPPQGGKKGNAQHAEDPRSFAIEARIPFFQPGHRPELFPIPQ